MENKSLWKIYKERYLNRKTSFTDIEKFLIDDYGIELLHISIETPVEPYHRWKAVCGKINVHTIAAQKYIAPQAA